MRQPQERLKAFEHGLIQARRFKFPLQRQARILLGHGQEFDLLFTDVILPGGMNGQQLAEEVRKVDAHMKVLFTSGYPAFAFKHLGLDEMDTLRLLRKPYRSIDLKAALTDVFNS